MEGFTGQGDLWRHPGSFRPRPRSLAPVMREEAEAVWRDWHPMIWRIITFRGCFGGVAQSAAEVPRREGFVVD